MSKDSKVLMNHIEKLDVTLTVLADTVEVLAIRIRTLEDEMSKRPLARAKRVEINASVGAGLSETFDLGAPFSDAILITDGNRPRAIHYDNAAEGKLTIDARMRVYIRAIYVVPLGAS